MAEHCIAALPSEPDEIIEEDGPNNFGGSDLGIDEVQQRLVTLLLWKVVGAVGITAAKP